MLKVVIITLLNDRHVMRTIDSLLNQEELPSRILVADGGNDKKLFHDIESYGGIVDVHKIYGSVGESRNKTLSLVNEDILAFIDSDEVATNNWLKNITKPIVNGDADFTGGKCIPMFIPKTKIERYIWEKEEQLFANYNQLSFQMGNTAWHRHVFDTIGNFDKRIIWGGEDYDINIRATNAGFKGKYVPEAILFHDKGVKTLSSWARKRFKYHTGSTVAYLKNNIEIGKKKGTLSVGSHPLDYLDLLLKMFAFMRGNIIWRHLQ